MKYVLIVLTLVCLGLFAFSLISIHQAVNTPVKASPVPPLYSVLKPINISFASVDDNMLAGWYFKVDHPKAVVIVMHGLSETTGGKSSMLGHVKYLNEAGYSAFLIDLRGFGESQFRKISFATQEWKDAVAAYYYMSRLPENNGRPVGFLGHSMGGATAIIAAGLAHKGDFVIADVPFASAGKFLKQQIVAKGLPPVVLYPFVQAAARLELGPEFSEISAEQYIGRVSVPLLVIQASGDTAVDPRDAQDLYDAAHSKKILWTAETSHDTYKDDPEGFEQHVLYFLESSL